MNSTEEILLEYKSYVHMVPIGLKKLLEELEDENYYLVEKELANMAEGIQWIITAKEILAVQKIKINFILEELNSCLKLLVEGLEKKDYILVSDVIEYELIPYFENLKVENQGE